MKRKKKLRWNRIILAVILLVAIVGGSIYLFKGDILKKDPEKPGVTAPKNPDHSSNDTKDPDGKEPSNPTVPKTYLKGTSKASSFTGNVDQKLEEVLVSFMDTYFTSMQTLEEKDMTSFFKSDAYEEAYLHQTALSLLIGTRKMEEHDMKLSSASYEIQYTKMQTNGNRITLDFLENDYLHFNFVKDIESKVFNVENTFVFEKVDDTYKVVSVRKVQDFYVMITNKYNTGKSDSAAKAALDNIKANHLDDYRIQHQKWMDNREDYLEGKNVPTKVCDHKYNREEALSYANKYITTRHPQKNYYDASGGNCQNYASQVMNAGGIPMDKVGDATWHHEDGHTPSYVTVTDFYAYAKNNTGYGLCALTDINPYYAEAGDEGQVGYDGSFRHTVVISGTVKDSNGKVIDLLLHSNTVDLENFPMSAYSYPNKRIIKIMGWND